MLLSVTTVWLETHRSSHLLYCFYHIVSVYQIQPPYAILNNLLSAKTSMHISARHYNKNRQQHILVIANSMRSNTSLQSGPLVFSSCHQLRLAFSLKCHKPFDCKSWWPWSHGKKEAQIRKPIIAQLPLSATLLFTQSLPEFPDVKQ